MLKLLKRNPKPIVLAGMTFQPAALTPERLATVLRELRALGPVLARYPRMDPEAHAEQMIEDVRLLRAWLFEYLDLSEGERARITQTAEADEIVAAFMAAFGRFEIDLKRMAK